MSFFRKCNGSISLFLVLILVPMYTCAYLAIDSVKYYAMKTKLNGSLNLVGNASLANFSYPLHEKYGIFAMGIPNVDQESYLYTIFKDNIGSANEISSFKFSYDENTSLSNPIELMKCIERSLKYEAPYEFTKELSSKIEFFLDVLNVSKVLENASSYIEGAADLEKKLRKIWNVLSEINTNEVQTTIAQLENMQKELNSLKKQAGELKKHYDMLEKSVNDLQSGALRAEFEQSLLKSGRLLLDSAVASLERDVKGSINNLKNGVKEDILMYAKNELYEYMKENFGVNLSESESIKLENLKTILGGDMSELYKTVDDFNYFNLVSSEVYSEIFGSLFKVESESPESLAHINQEEDIASFSYVIKEFAETEFTKIRSNVYMAYFIKKNFDNFVAENRATCGQTEFIVFGNENRLSNIRRSINLIFALRVVMNAIFAFSNTEMREKAATAAGVLSTVSGVGTILAKNILLLTWSMAEAYVDLNNLCGGKSVPMIKSSESWITTAENIPKILDGSFESNEIDGNNLGLYFTYNDYITIFTLFKMSTEKSKENMLRRCALIMQIECRKMDDTFDIGRCYTRAESDASISFGSHTLEGEKRFGY